METIHNDCAYCAKGDLLNAFAYPEGIELKASYLYVFREQSHPGRVIIASKHHVSEVVDLPASDRKLFFDDVCHAAEALHKAFPDMKKLNYGMYGDTGCHLHMHLVPKYENEFEYGGTFEMNPGKTLLNEDEYREILNKIKNAL